MAHGAAVFLWQISERRGMIYTGLYAAASFQDLVHGSYSPRQL